RTTNQATNQLSDLCDINLSIATDEVADQSCNGANIYTTQSARTTNQATNELSDLCDINLTITANQVADQTRDGTDIYAA
ncbi:hypothetical protein O6215_23945, partial [Salmonella enterica subsp. enterica]